MIEEQIRLDGELSGMVGGVKGKVRTKEFSAADVELRSAIALECVHPLSFRALRG